MRTTLHTGHSNWKTLVSTPTPFLDPILSPTLASLGSTHHSLVGSRHSSRHTQLDTLGNTQLDTGLQYWVQHLAPCLFSLGAKHLTSHSARKLSLILTPTLGCNTWLQTLHSLRDTFGTTSTSPKRRPRARSRSSKKSMVIAFDCDAHLFTDFHTCSYTQI
jgi:hypothetical protein